MGIEPTTSPLTKSQRKVSIELELITNKIIIIIIIIFFFKSPKNSLNSFLNLIVYIISQGIKFDEFLFKYVNMNLVAKSFHQFL